jgi:hypothetical protein
VPGRAIVAALGALLAPRGSSGADPAALAYLRSPDFPWPRLVGLAGAHMMIPALREPVIGLGLRPRLGEELWDFVDAVHALNVERNRMLRDDAEAIVGSLARRDIEPVFLKGMALELLGVFPDPGTRFMRDIDLLVPEEDLEGAGAALAELGYRPGKIEEGAHDELRMLHPERPSMVEIHRAPLPVMLGRVLSAERVLSRRVPIAGFGSGAAFAPHPTDLVIHNAAHAMLHDRLYVRGELPLKDAYDLALASGRYRGVIDWDEARAQLSASATGGAVMAFYGTRTRALFGADAVPVFRQSPEAVLTYLRWRRRGGRPADVSSPRSPRRNLAELAWRFLVVPNTRSRINRAIFRPHMYQAYWRKLRRIARRKDGISSL